MSDCQCFNAILANKSFNHHTREKDRLDSVFDDFGYNVYVDNDDVEHKLLSHTHLGVYKSYSHEYDDRDDSRKFLRYEKDNSVIAQIKKNGSKKNYSLKIKLKENFLVNFIKKNISSI